MSENPCLNSYHVCLFVCLFLFPLFHNTEKHQTNINKDSHQGLTKHVSNLDTSKNKYSDWYKFIVKLICII